MFSQLWKILPAFLELAINVCHITHERNIFVQKSPYFSRCQHVFHCPLISLKRTLSMFTSTWWTMLELASLLVFSPATLESPGDSKEHRHATESMYRGTLRWERSKHQFKRVNTEKMSLKMLLLISSVVWLSPFAALEASHCTDVSEWGPVRFIVHCDVVCVSLNEVFVFVECGVCLSKCWSFKILILYILNVFCVSLKKVSFSLKVTWEEREPCCASEVVNLLGKFSLVDSYIN